MSNFHNDDNILIEELKQLYKEYQSLSKPNRLTINDSNRKVLLRVKLDKLETSIISSILEKQEYEKLFLLQKFNIAPMIYGGNIKNILKCPNITILEYIINNGRSMEYGNYFGRTLIHYACRYGSINFIKLLIDKNFDLEESDFNGMRPIHYACYTNNIDLVNLLINKVNLESVTVNGDTPLHIACKNKNYDIVKLLIKKNVNLESKNIHGRRPIHNACIKPKMKIVKLIIDGYYDKYHEIKKTRSFVNLNCLDEFGKLPIDYTKNNKNVYYFMNTKMLLNCTIFRSYTGLEVMIIPDVRFIH